ncbi:hypothetical protein LIER_13328 [Lithospermum erythrorhizon]|uniref:RNase H type-1 domain-containing protein n=1 Tax=Lithospermum erythrorhizon TaxID=34254 RepID=A0AAV3PXJ3_LITER
MSMTCGTSQGRVSKLSPQRTSWSSAPMTRGNLIEDSQEKVWLLYIDGASNPGGSGAGILLWIPEGNMIEYALRFAFTATNNEAEYEALANGLPLANALGVEHIHIQTDSQLLVGHVKSYFEIVETKERLEADRLSQLAMAGYETLPEATVVEWVEEEAFMTKEVMNNNAPEGGGILGALLSRYLKLPKDQGPTRRSLGG